MKCHIRYVEVFWGSKDTISGQKSHFWPLPAKYLAILWNVKIPQNREKIDFGQKFKFLQSSRYSPEWWSMAGNKVWGLQKPFWNENSIYKPIYIQFLKNPKKSIFSIFWGWPRQHFGRFCILPDKYRPNGISGGFRYLMLVSKKFSYSLKCVPMIISLKMWVLKKYPKSIYFPHFKKSLN